MLGREVLVWTTGGCMLVTCQCVVVVGLGDGEATQAPQNRYHQLGHELCGTVTRG